MDTEQQLNGKSAIVTGAGVRLGRAFALGLAKAGANVAVHYGRSADEAQETAELARSFGVRAVALQADLSQAEDATNLVNQCKEAIGDLQILVNSASIFEPVDIFQTDIESWNRHLAVNLTAPFLISKSFAENLGEAIGTIVNILDWRALRPGTHNFPYTIAKSGLAAMTKSMAQAFAPNIRVNGLALGAILPPSSGETDDPLEGVPLERWGTVDEAVDGMLFLLAGSEYVTGAILHIDGGRHLS
ncbi:MAG: SDR family oxidoreductase [Anaerolineales bacterium]|nr:SDR family oxidoreductase [Anaerolineales bacterium]